MMFHRVAVSKIPQQAVTKAAAVATRSLASAAVPSYMPIEEDNEAGDVVVAAAVEDSFAFYPVQKNRIQGMYKPNHEAARECFSFYPSNGIIVETQNPITQIAAASAAETESTLKLDVASTKTKMNDDIISKDEWRSLIEERLMNVKSNPIAAAAAASTTTVGVVDDSFAFYPVQSNRVQTQVTKEARECFSFYPSSNGQQQEIKAAAFDTTTTAEEEAEVVSVRHNFADGVPAHVKDQVKTSEFFGEKKESFEDFTPSPTEWSSITIMQALSKKTTTTFAVSS